MASEKILDLRHRDPRRGDPYLEALVKTDDDAKELREYDRPFRPYCHTRQDDFAEHVEALREAGYSCGDARADGYVKIEADSPWDIRDLKYDEEWEDLETFEADVNYERRVLIDQDMGIDLPDDEDILFFDIEVDPRGGFPEPDEADKQVLSIATIDGEGNRAFFSDQDETALLEEFLAYLDDYLVLAGWNSQKFDLPYLENRIEHLGLYYDWFEVVHVDVMMLYRNLAGDADSFNLDDVGEREFDMGKEFDFGAGEMDRLWDWFVEQDERLRRYNEKDVEITKKVHEQYAAVQFMFRMAQQSHTRASQLAYVNDRGNSVLAVGKACDSVILKIAHQDGIVLPDKGKFKDTHDFPGGHVIEPDPGTYTDVTIVDFSGMYPSIVKTWNIGPNTWHDQPYDCAPEGANRGITALVDQGCDEIFDTPGEMDARGWFDSVEEEKSILAKGIEVLEEHRMEAKAKRNAATRGTEEWKKWKAIDASWKALVNSFYGICASPVHRYFQPGMSEHITEGGQTLIGETKRFCEGHPDVQQIVTGDTDSVIVQLDASGEDTVEVAKRVASDVNDHIKAVAEELCGVDPELLKVDLDEVFANFIITDKKKKYAGYVIYDDGPCFDTKITGFECIKSNWPKSVRDYQYELLMALLDGRSTTEIIESAKEDLFHGKFDADLVTRKGLGSDPDDYEGTPPVHARAAMDIREQQGDGAIGQGDKVPYLKYGQDTDQYTACPEGELPDFRPNEGYCEECERVVFEPHDHETAEHPHLRAEHYSYLWNKRFGSINERLGVSRTEQTSLGAYG